jgi:hypothetical protein
MSSLRKLKRDHASADLSAIEGMIGGLTDEDVLTRMSLEGRRDELREQLAAIPTEEEQLASAAVFFGGRPVVGSMGIESEFGGKAVSMLQDLVSKQFAHDGGGIGQRGVVPDKSGARLHVTDVLRGSFGFLLEELQPQGQLLDTSLKASLDRVTELLSAFAEPSEEGFETAVEAVDERVLTAAQEFFSLLRREGATLRMVAGDIEHSFDETSVERAAERAKVTTVVDKEESIEGQLAGILPDAHRFEFRTVGPRGIIEGRVDHTLSASDAAQLITTWLNKDAVAIVAVRQVYKDETVVRESFTLRGIRGQ